jgi:hypothetical protein
MTKTLDPCSQRITRLSSAVPQQRGRPDFFNKVCVLRVRVFVRLCGIACVRVRVCVRAHCACARARVRVRVCVRACVRTCTRALSCDVRTVLPDNVSVCVRVCVCVCARSLFIDDSIG